MGGAIGALVYIVVEVVPDVGLLRGASRSFHGGSGSRRSKALIVDNPSVGNYEELGDLLSRRRAVRAGARVLRSRDREERLNRSVLPPRAVRAGAGRFRCRRRRSRARRRARSEIRLSARRRTARARARAGWRARGGRRAVRGGPADVDALRNAVRLRVLPRGDRPRRRSARMGGAHPAEEGDDARLHPPPRAAVVPEDGGAPQTDSLTAMRETLVQHQAAVSTLSVIAGTAACRLFDQRCFTDASRAGSPSRP